MPLSNFLKTYDKNADSIKHLSAALRESTPTLLPVYTEHTLLWGASMVNDFAAKDQRDVQIVDIYREGTFFF